ncbi:uncharacterized protein PHACADRAFT_107624, partial [Phanerochaete carnosa HHB-10118-sp]
QAASYVIKILSNTNSSCAHCLGIVLWHEQLSLWLYDAAGVVATSDQLSVIQDFEKFAAILICLACCSAERLGAMPKICLPNDTPYPDHFPPKSMDGHTINMFPANCDSENAEITPIFAKYALVGRHTTVYNATAENLLTCAPGTPLVVKFSQQVHTCLKEQDLLNAARAARVRNLPSLRLARDLWSLSEGFCGLFCEEEPVNYERRVLRAPVFTKYEPLEVLFSRSSRYLGEMVYQMLNCDLHDLRYRVLILHRGVSFNNIMVLTDEPDGKPLFILNDFDLATCATVDGKLKGGPISKHHTGTLPFMSYELLHDMWSTYEVVRKLSGDSPLVPARHHLRFDYELLLYIALWCTFKCEKLRFTEARNVINAQVEQWECGAYSDRDLFSRKLMLLTKIMGPNSLREMPLSPPFEPWLPFFEAWMDTVQPADHLLQRANY